jgi:TetR/AcrR family transcriptional regulator, mexCD-oprJ operon repressor
MSEAELVPQLGPRQALQERVAAAIIAAAARALVEHGEHVSMADVATAAGVARATVYRYFPSREALLADVAKLAVADAGERLASARIAEVPPEQGVSRAVRALTDAGDPFIVLVRERVQVSPDEFEDAVAQPLRHLFERGQAAGTFREDISTSWLVEALIGLMASVLSAKPRLGREDTTAAIASLFLEGARAPREQDGRSPEWRRNR